MRFPLLSAIALALLAPAAAAAAAPRLHGIPAHVRGGAELRITWSGLGPGADEAELELSLAGGRWVRISPELEAREGGFTWRVPSGLAGPARLRLRYGGEGFEAEGDVSTPFVLEPDAATTRAPDRGVGDEWWNLGRSSGPLPGPHVAGAPSLQPRVASLALSPEPDRMARLAVSFAGHASVRTREVANRDRVRRRDVFVRCLPLRI